MDQSSSLNIFAVLRSPELAEIVTVAVRQIPGATISVRIGDIRTLPLSAIHSAHPDVFLADVDAEDPADLAALSHIMHAPECRTMSTLATTEHATISAMRRLLREGVVDCLPQPLSEADVVDGIRMVITRSKRRQPGKDGIVFSFIQASGGMGSTSLAVHTALSLGMPNGKVPEVCLMDLDLQFGNAAMSLDLSNASGLLDVMRSPDRLDPTLLRGAMVRHKSGLFVLSAPNIPVPLDSLQPDTLSQVLELARQEFDYTVIDMPRALTSWTEALLAASDMILLVVQLNVPAIRQARRLLDTLQEEGHYSLPVSIVCNRYVRRWGEDVDVKQAEKALGHKIDFFIANDYPVVLSALNQGVSAFEVKRRSGFSKDVHALAKGATHKVAGVRARDAQTASNLEA